MRPLTHSCFLLLPLGRLLLLALPLFFKICLPSLWSPPFPLHALALIPPSLSLVKVRLSPTLTLSPLSRSDALDRQLYSFPFGKGGSGVLANCSLSVALRPLFPFQQAQYVQDFLLKPAPFCTLFAGLSSTNKSATPYLFSFYLTLVLFSPPVFSSIFFFISNSVADLAGTVFSHLLFYQATKDPWTLVSPRERRG